MDGKEILKLGFQPGKVVGLALKAAQTAQTAGKSEAEIQRELTQVLEAPHEQLQL